MSFAPGSFWVLRFRRGIKAVNEFSFTVFGDPIGQGSMRHIGGGRMIAANDKELRAWRKTIAAAVNEKRREVGKWSFEGAVGLQVRFIVRRKKTQEKLTHAVKPYDLDKLCRSVGDGISIDCDLVLNDSQIVRLDASKDFGDEPRAEIRVYAVI